MSRLDYRNVEKDPARCGGQPVVAGTRVRVATILTCYRLGMSIEEIVQQHPGLKPADVHDALAFAYDHLDEMEADLAADKEVEEKSKLRDPAGPGAQGDSSRMRMCTVPSPSPCGEQVSTLLQHPNLAALASPTRLNSPGLPAKAACW